MHMAASQLSATPRHKKKNKTPNPAHGKWPGSPAELPEQGKTAHGTAKYDRPGERARDRLDKMDPRWHQNDCPGGERGGVLGAGCWQITHCVWWCLLCAKPLSSSAYSLHPEPRPRVKAASPRERCDRNQQWLSSRYCQSIPDFCAPT